VQRICLALLALSKVSSAIDLKTAIVIFAVAINHAEAILDAKDEVILFSLLLGYT